MSKELEELFEAITNKRKEFFEKYLKMPNTIEMNKCMYSKLVEHFVLNDYMRDNLFKKRPQIFGMNIFLSLLAENNEDINCYYIEGTKALDYIELLGK